MLRSSNKAFSLVELSIVLVILGLLVGGVLSGQSLIHASELRATLAQLNNLHAATKTFQDKYFALPGDLPNATLFWGRGGWCNTQTLGAIDYANGTCNGNGSGTLGDNAPGWYDNTSVEENNFVLHHLTRAGLISEVQNDLTSFPTTIPAKFSNVGIFAGSTGRSSTFCGMGAGGGPLYGRSVWGFEVVNRGYCVNNVTGAMKAEDAWNMDKKVDDGLPGSGIVMTMDTGYFDFGAGSPQRCVDAPPFSATPPTRYNLTDTTFSCVPVFVMGAGM